MTDTGRTFHLHIGLPKTATTFLQDSVFPQMDGIHAACTPPAPAGLDPARQSESLMAWALRRSPDVWHENRGPLLAGILGCGAQQQGGDVLVSDERIGRAGSRARHLGAHLRAIAAAARSAGFERTTCLCAVRRQDLWYASHYAQISDRNPRAGQRDFEAAVERLVDPDRGGSGLGRLLRYDDLRAALVEALGADNVLMVVHETMRDSPDAFVTGLAEFLGRPVSLDGTGPRDSPGAGSNVRNAGGRTWRLRQFNRHAAGRSGGAARGLARAGLRRLGGGAGGSFDLTPDLSARILEAYRSTNLRLARSLDTDLGRFGYF